MLGALKYLEYLFLVPVELNAPRLMRLIESLATVLLYAIPLPPFYWD